MLEINFSPFPLLTTDRLILRSITPEDASVIFKLRSNPDVMQYVNRPLVQSMEEAVAWVELVMNNVKNNIGITWCICLKNNPSENIGNIGLWRIECENYRAEIGYMLEPTFHKKGIMSEALNRIIDFGFSQMNLHSIEAQIDPENKASAKLLEKSGFKKEAHLKENIFWKGRFEDTAIYSVIKNAESV